MCTPFTTVLSTIRPVLGSAREGNTGNGNRETAIECFLVRYGDALAVLWHWSGSVTGRASVGSRVRRSSRAF